MIDTKGEIHIWRDSKSVPLGWSKSNNYSRFVVDRNCVNFFFCKTCFSLLIKKWDTLLSEDVYMLVTKNNFMYFENYISEAEFNDVLKELNYSKRLQAVINAASGTIRKGGGKMPPNSLYPGI